MGLRDDKESYGFISRFFHWFMAFGFLMAYGTVYYRHWFTKIKTGENWTVLQLHLSVGVTLGVLVLLRILWRITSETPTYLMESSYEKRAIKTGHILLYGIMLIAPLTGYLGTGAHTEYFFLFDIPKFESTSLFREMISNGLGMTFAAFEKPMDYIHKTLLGKWFVWLLILGHMGFALHHSFVKKDGTLSKMLGKSK